MLSDHFEYLDSLETKQVETTKCCEQEENMMAEDGIVKCKCCGNTIYNICDNPEWRFYGANSSTKKTDQTRCGMPINKLLPQSSLGSTISYSSNNKTLHHIRKYQQWNSMPYKERSRYKIFLEIQRNCKENHIPEKIISEAKSLYTIISTTKISRGANRKGIIAACVYYSCKECEVPRSSKEIAEMFHIEATVMTRGCKKFREIMNLNKKDKNRLSNTVSVKPQDFIERFCNKLNIEAKFVKIIKDICKKAIDNNIITENTPPSIAAGCIYFASKWNPLNITRKQISTVCKISEVTINKCSKKIEGERNLFCDDGLDGKENTSDQD
jgi:transcription initiation factor TFIIB